MFKSKIVQLLVSFILATSVPLLPYIVNGSPFIGDSWTHFKIVNGTITSSHYTIVDYNERWPLVNLLLSFISILTNLPEVIAGAMVPLLVGMASIPLYCLCKRLGKSPSAALVATLFLTFNPIYSYITFSGAVMKETSAYYLILVMLLLSTLMLGERSQKSHVVTALLTSFGVVLGHHYASLAVLLSLWALMGYQLSGALKETVSQLRSVVTLTLGFTLIAGAWNLFNYLALRAYFPIFNLNELTLLIASFIAIWAFQAMEERTPLMSWPWLASLAFTISVLGLRGGIYLLAQPTALISIWEVRNYLVTGTFALLGLAIKHSSMVVKALSASTLSLVIFAYVWGFTQPGYVLLIKSLHYFSILLAIGAGFASTALIRRGIIGKATVLGIVIFTIYASWHGTYLALNGLGAYHRGELLAASNLPEIVPGIKVLGDTRASYLMPYAADITPSGIKIKEASTNSLLLLFRPNLHQGFLLDYDWIPTRFLIDDSNIDSWNRIVDGEYLKVLLR